MNLARHVWKGARSAPLWARKGWEMFEAVQYIDRKTDPTAPPEETILGEFADEGQAVEVARAARDVFTNSEDYAWWLVRQSGARLARWIADSRSDKEFVLDLTSGELMEVE